MKKQTPLLCIGVLGCFLASSLHLVANENEWFVPLGKPPEPPPKRISGGEAFAPLPLPATPLRRSERKRPPTPPPLFGKVIWGEQGSFTYSHTGTSTKINDWSLCPGDLQQICSKIQSVLGLPYGWEETTLANFHGDPDKTSCLFFSGTRTLKLDDKQLSILRAFVLKGGMLVFDSVAGSPYFTQSAQALMQKTFPELTLRTIPLDHPIYHVVSDVSKVAYSKNNPSTTPELQGLYVGSRIGVLISPFGLGCGWDNHEVPLIAKAVYYDVPSAEKIGLNLAAYIVGYNKIGREESKPELFGAADEKKPTDEFVFAQIQHEGAYNVHPNSAASLLTRARESTSLRVNLKRVGVIPGKDDLSPYTFLYLTGLDDFSFNDAALAALRKFISNDGTLLINNGLGLSKFDIAARREISKLLPAAKLEPIPMNHPVFSTVFKITDARYSPAVALQKKAGNTPRLEGITINRNLRVIYSPIDLEAGWVEGEYPMSCTYQSSTAIPLGLNILVYSSTH